MILHRALTEVPFTVAVMAALPFLFAVTFPFLDTVATLRLLLLHFTPFRFISPKKASVKKVNYKSSNKRVASVSKKGVIQAMKNMLLRVFRPAALPFPLVYSYLPVLLSPPAYLFPPVLLSHLQFPVLLPLPCRRGFFPD